MRAESRTIEHVGEWRVALSADTLEDLFAEVARVIASSAGSTHVEATEWEPVTITARDVPTLLADWANELLGRSEAAGLSYGEVRHVRVRHHRDGTEEIAAEVRGQPVEEWISPLKAATYHGLSLERRARRWHAMLLFDV